MSWVTWTSDFTTLDLQAGKEGTELARFDFEDPPSKLRAVSAGPGGAKQEGSPFAKLPGK